MFSSDFKTLLTNLFYDVNELLRHYLSFKAKVHEDHHGHHPQLPHTILAHKSHVADAKVKLERIKSKMGEKYEHVERLKAKLPPSERTTIGSLLIPLMDQLNLPFLED